MLCVCIMLEMSIHKYHIVCKSIFTYNFTFLFASSFKVCLPVTSVHTTSFPNFTFRSPGIITASHLEMYQLQNVNLKRKCPLTSTILSSLGAYTLCVIIRARIFMTCHIFYLTSCICNSWLGVCVCLCMCVCVCVCGAE